jgi:hypothetical protein
MIFLTSATSANCFGEAQAVQGSCLSLLVFLKPTVTHQSSKSAVQSGWQIAITKSEQLVRHTLIKCR